jgi:hypothetical protein
VKAQIVGWVNLAGRTNLPQQIGALTKRRDKAALIWPCRRVRLLALHSYPSAPLARGFLFAVAAELPREIGEDWPGARTHRGRAAPSNASRGAQQATVSRLAAHWHHVLAQRIRRIGVPGVVAANPVGALVGLALAIFHGAGPRLADVASETTRDSALPTDALRTGGHRPARTPVGVSPKRARNRRLKCEGSENPVCSAISEMRRPPACGWVSRAKARWSRNSFT